MLLFILVRESDRFHAWLEPLFHQKERVYISSSICMQKKIAVSYFKFEYISFILMIDRILQEICCLIF